MCYNPDMISRVRKLKEENFKKPFVFYTETKSSEISKDRFLRCVIIQT